MATDKGEKRGRPSLYSVEIADAICERLSSGMTLREVCRADDMPDESTVRKWALRNHEDFFPQYAEAREVGYHAMADELIEIADDGSNDWMERNGSDGQTGDTVINGEHVQRSRLRLDTRKWLLSKALPKVYGDKLAVGGDKDMDPIVTKNLDLSEKEIARRLAFLLTSGAKDDS